MIQQENMKIKTVELLRLLQNNKLIPEYFEYREGNKYTEIFKDKDTRNFIEHQWLSAFSKSNFKEKI